MASNLDLRGDEAEIFASHHTTLHSRVRRWVNTSDAIVDDACSIAWLQLLRCQPHRETALSWLTTVAINEAIRLDRRHRRVEYTGTVELFETEDAIDLDVKLRALEALEAVANLPDRQRRLAELHASGFTYDEIAELSGAAHVADVGRWAVGRQRRVVCRCRGRAGVGDVSRMTGMEVVDLTWSGGWRPA